MMTVPTFGVRIPSTSSSGPSISGRSPSVGMAGVLTSGPPDAHLQRGERVREQLRADVVDAVHQRRRLVPVVGEAARKVVPPKEFGLEPDDVLQAAAEVPQAGLGGQVDRVRHAGRLRRAGGTRLEHQPVTHVLHELFGAALDGLRRHHQVDPVGAALTADRVEDVDRRRHDAEPFVELVDDDHEHRQRRHVLATRPHPAAHRVVFLGVVDTRAVADRLTTRDLPPTVRRGSAPSTPGPLPGR